MHAALLEVVLFKHFTLNKSVQLKALVAEVDVLSFLFKDS